MNFESPLLKACLAYIDGIQEGSVYSKESQERLEIIQALRKTDAMD